MLMFYCLAELGTTLYGEVRGASRLQRVFAGISRLWTTVLLSVILLVLFAFFGSTLPGRERRCGRQRVRHTLGARAADLPYPVLLGRLGGHTRRSSDPALLMSLWFFAGWTLFLSSTR